jgi:hypothetical protein
MNRISKTILIIIALVITGGTVVQFAYAFDSVERESMMFDENLADQTQNKYAKPEKILISQIQSQAESLSIDSELWVDTLYYYYITRLGFADLPFNYLVDRNGNIYEGRQGGVGLVPELSEPEGSLLIGYLSNSSGLTASAQESIQDIVNDISYKYGIERDAVMPVELSIDSESIGDGSLSKLIYEEAKTIFGIEMSKFLDTLNYSNEDHLQYSATISEVNAEPSVLLGEKLKVTLKVENNGEEPWFTFNDFIYIHTADGEDSEFAVNGEWDSFEAPTHIEGETVLPGESVDVEFYLNALTLPGDYSEEFILSREGGRTLLGTNFEISFKIDAGDTVLVEILPTQTGSLNVRETPEYNSNLIGQVDIGKKYILVESQGAWHKIKYSGDDEGWVYAKYVKVL